MTSVLDSDLMTNGDFINVVSLYDDGRRQGFIQHFITGRGWCKQEPGGVTVTHGYTRDLLTYFTT